MDALEELLLKGESANGENGRDAHDDESKSDNEEEEDGGEDDDDVDGNDSDKSW